MIQFLLGFKKKEYYLILSFVCILFSSCMIIFIYTEDLYCTTFEGQYTIEQIHYFFEANKLFRFIAVIIIPIVIIIRILYTSLCLFIGVVFNELQCSYKILFNISLKADFVNCLSTLSNFYYYAFTEDYNNINDLSTNFLSILKIVGRDNVSDWLVILINSVNIFEFGYILMLSVLINNQLKMKFIQSYLFVLFTYGLGNYLFVFLISYFNLNYIK